MKSKIDSSKCLRRGQSGAVLIIVLWVSLGLVALAITFGHSMQMAYRASQNDVAGRQADSAIDAGLRYAEQLLANSASPGALPDVRTYQSEAVPVGDAAFWFIGRDNNTAPTTTPVFGLIDEASKVNLNSASPDLLASLLGSISDAGLADAIVDWRTSNAAGSAYSSYYMTQTPPYQAKQAPFETTEELGMVYGMTQAILFGEDANLNGCLDPNEDDGAKSDPPDNSNGLLDPGLLEYVTVFTREPNTSTDGTPKTNVSKPPAITAALTPFLTAQRAGEIQENVVRSFPPGVPNATLKSPMELYLRGKFTADEFAKVADAVTFTDGQYVTGRINVNTASQAVLSSIPGITSDNVSAILTARQGRAAADTGITWVADILGAPAGFVAGPFLTGRSYQTMADIAAVGQNGSGFRRTRFVIDTSSGAPVVVYRRELSHLGWALGRYGRQSLALRGTGT